MPRSEWTKKEGHHDEHQQFGNNFYCLFQGRLNREKCISASQYGQYLLIDSMESKYKNKWTNFLENNGDLIKKIDESLEGNAVYCKVLYHYIDLLKDRNYIKAEEYAKLGIEEVGVYYWRIINPLLKEAAEKMQELGIPIEEFSG